MVSLYVTSHYNNSPNDLQLMSDTPTHELFVLVHPVTAETDTLPAPVCVIQVALEGEVSKESIMRSLGRSKKPDGGLIPYLVIEQFQHEEFASLSGARIVQIATNPYRTPRGCGSRAAKLLIDH